MNVTPSHLVGVGLAIVGENANKTRKVKELEARVRELESPMLGSSGRQANDIPLDGFGSDWLLAVIIMFAFPASAIIILPLAFFILCAVVKDKLKRLLGRKPPTEHQE